MSLPITLQSQPTVIKGFCEDRMLFGPFNPNNDTDPRSRKVGVRSYSLITGIFFYWLGYAERLNHHSGAIYFVNKNSLNSWFNRHPYPTHSLLSIVFFPEQRIDKACIFYTLRQEKMPILQALDQKIERLEQQWSEAEKIPDNWRKEKKLDAPRSKKIMWSAFVKFKRNRTERARVEAQSLRKQKAIYTEIEQAYKERSALRSELDIMDISFKAVLIYENGAEKLEERAADYEKTANKKEHNLRCLFRMRTIRYMLQGIQAKRKENEKEPGAV